MTLPKYYETFIPLLESLKDRKVIHRTELQNKVLNSYYTHLPDDLMHKKLKSGGSLILNRIGWGISYLKQGNYLNYPKRGMIQITSKGIKILSKGTLSFKEFQADPDVVEYHKKKVEQKKICEKTIESSTPEDLIESGVSDIEDQVKVELLEKLKSVNPYFFEKIILKLLKRMGYGNFIETRKSHDGGIDGIINQDHLGLEKIYIQAKRYGDNKVREKDIRNFIGAMSGDTSKGVFVTTSTFDKSAIVKASSAHHVISLIDGKKLVQLMFDHNVGIQVRETYEIKELDLDFFEEV
ncbi:MAG: restriction endonuclease [Chlamydiota bacterium]|nr:restriction endonuclease [Chlamydiota bacterium]